MWVWLTVQGAIRVRIFNKHMGAACRPLQELTVREGDVSWACSNYFQTHQLTNDTDDFCATIQVCVCSEAGVACAGSLSAFSVMGLCLCPSFRCAVQTCEVEHI